MGVRPDSITVVSIDVRTGAALLVSLPRNLEKARLTDGSAAADRFPSGFAGEGERSEWLLNATWTYGEANPKLLMARQAQALPPSSRPSRAPLACRFSTPVIDLNGFRDLVDALGGVTIRVTEAIPIGEKGT